MVIIVGIIAYIVLRAGSTLARYIRSTGISIITRIMGLIIAAIAIEMVAEGVSSLFKLAIKSS